MINENGDTVVECPYDSVHMIVEKYLSKHLMRCRENHKTHKKVACKFDKTHVIPKPELPHHLSVCPSRKLLDRELQLKASVDGVHCGDVKGPKIVTQHEDDEEEWGSVPASAAPMGLFNRRNMDHEESESDKPHTIPGANYPSRFPRSAAAASLKDAFREFPTAPSKVAQGAEMSKMSTRPDSVSQAYLNTLTQFCSNPGFGRGQGIHQQQAVSVSAGISRPVSVPQPLRFERFTRGHNQSHDQTSEVNNSHNVPRLDSTSVKQQLNGLCNQQLENNLAQEYRSSLGQFEDNGTESYRPETLTAGQLMAGPRHGDQTDVPLLPKGRGCLRGIEQLRAASVSVAQGSGYNKLLDPQRVKGHSGRDVSNGLPEQNGIRDKENNFTDAVNKTSPINSEDLQRAERKLRKKLKQLKTLEQKSAAGLPLNEEEKNKLEKKDEIMSLIESISKRL